MGRRIDRGLDQPELHRAGIVGGYLFGSRLFRLSLQPQAAALSPLLDGRMGDCSAQLSWTRSLWRGTTVAAPDGARSVAVCSGGNLFLSWRAALRAASTVDHTGRHCRGRAGV